MLMRILKELKMQNIYESLLLEHFHQQNFHLQKKIY